MFCASKSIVEKISRREKILNKEEGEELRGEELRGERKPTVKKKGKRKGKVLDF
jgi:hypothetical protein